MKSFSSLIILFVLYFCKLGAIASAETTLRIALPYADPIAESFVEELASQLSDKSDGELNWRFFPDGSLGRSDELFGGVVKGIVDIALLPARRPFFTTGLSSPFTFSGFDAAVSYFQSFERTDNETTIAFAVIPTDVALLIGQNPIVPKDLANLKILTRRPDFAGQYGAYRPYRTSLVDLLKTGLPEGSVAEGFLFRLGAPQGARTVTRFDHRFLAYVVLVGRDRYNALSDDNKRVLGNAITHASSEALIRFRNRIPQELQRLRELGWDVNDQTPVVYASPNETNSGDDCTADEYLKKYENGCKCETGNQDNEC